MSPTNLPIDPHEPCPCGCRRDVEPKPAHRAPCVAGEHCGEAAHCPPADADPATVPTRIGDTALAVADALEDAAHQVDDDQPTEAPEGTEGAERPTGANLAIEGTWLVREVGRCTCSPYGSSHEPGCGLEPEVNLATLPGWPRVLGEGQVAVDRDDVEFALHAMRAARHETESPETEARFRAALDAGSES